ncbi:MAG: DUF5693 family protein, partial [Candidatus Eremiobacteraeota bacterium]|nr:DUF5693 family protein [Candidatus Eremiobacteraeota bacterium]
GIGVGIGDVIDTFSHLHTPIAISLLRVINGLVIGIIIGAILIAIYRAIQPHLTQPASDTSPASPSPSAPVSSSPPVSS